MGAQVVTPVAWDQARWLRILECIEYRQTDVGLRFWGPPLWLEVTMTGPDSDAWSTAGALALPDQSWDWQSTEPCTVAMEMEMAGAADDRLLSAASEYTIENLILNATHEIGEWLRFDARRPFAAHGPRTDGNPETLRAPDGRQGNGVVSLHVDFGILAGAASPSCESPDGADTDGLLDRLAARVNVLAAPWRFSYLPGTLISYGRSGPLVTDSGALPKSGWELPWSEAVVGASALGDEEFVVAVQRQVHRMLVLRETHRICEAFYVNGERPWRLESPLAQNGATNAADGRSALAVAISYDQ